MGVFGNKIRNLREDKGILLRQTAAHLEVDTAWVSKCETSKKSMTREQVIKLAQFYSESQSELLKYWICEKIITAFEDEPYLVDGLELAINQLKKDKK